MSDALMSSSNFDRAILHIECRIREAKDVPEDFRVVPEPGTREIYEVVENGVRTRDEMQAHLDISYSDLVDLLQVMVRLNMLERRFNRENDNEVEYVIVPIEEDGTSGQPALVPA